MDDMGMEMAAMKKWEEQRNESSKIGMVNPDIRVDG